MAKVLSSSGNPANRKRHSLPSLHPSLPPKGSFPSTPDNTCCSDFQDEHRQLSANRCCVAKGVSPQPRGVMLV